MICFFTMNAKEVNSLYVYMFLTNAKCCVAGGSRQLSQENLLFAFLFVLALEDIIY